MMLKPFVSKFFDDLGGVQKAFETDFNTYIVQLLGLIDAMMRLGFYNDEDDLITVIDPLISLLDGSLDIIDQQDQGVSRKNTSKNNSMIEEGKAGDVSQGAPPQSQSMMNNSAMASMLKKEDESLLLRMKRYKMNESNLLIMDTKSNILNILQRVLDIQNDVRLTQFLTKFQKSDQENPPSELEITFIGKVLRTKKIEEIFKKDIELAELKPEIDGRVVSWVNAAFKDKKLDLETISKADFVCVLLDLILYENP